MVIALITLTILVPRPSLPCWCNYKLFSKGPSWLFWALLVSLKMEGKLAEPFSANHVTWHQFHGWKYLVSIMIILMQVSLFSVLILCNISFILKNPSFAETIGLLHNSICWVDTPLLLRCMCSKNTSNFP